MIRQLLLAGNLQFQSYHGTSHGTVKEQPLQTILEFGHQKIFQTPKNGPHHCSHFKTPRPIWQFTVEVNVSDVDVGAVLSQQVSRKPKLYLVAFFSLSTAELNYDTRDRELLTIKLALEERLHWLEGNAYPFVIRTDHKNLEYLHMAKRLNACQVRWTLFLACFSFTLQYLFPNIASCTRPSMFINLN